MLPIDPYLPQLVRAVQDEPVVLLRATPGAGKTTRVPAALLKRGGYPGRILVLEPRRVAAKFAAMRVAQELGVELGSRVGYQFRFEKKLTDRTELVFLTEGMFLRWLASHPTLEGISIVVLDEFHERSLSGDVALAAVRKLQQTRRPDLKLLIMSATLETEALQKYLASQGLAVTAVDVEAQRFPLEIRYLLKPVPERGLEAAVERACRQVVDERPTGDLLVFLPGMGEIRRVEERLADLAREQGLVVLPLHGELTRDEQDRAILPGKKRKIVLSTNIAETSLTIDGVAVVIDSGLARVGAMNPATGIPTLVTQTVSKASSLQRAGRAARQGPGLCLRLYTAGEYESRKHFDVPEILRSDLAPVFLDLLASNLGDPRGLDWLTKPGEGAGESAFALLQALGAVDGAGVVTALGRTLSQAPVHPRISRLLLEAKRRGVEEAALTLSAWMLEGDALPQDPIDSLLTQRSAPALGFAGRKLREQLARWLGQAHDVSGPGFSAKAADAEEALARALLAGFPDRVAKRRPGSKPDAPKVELFLAGGGTAWAESTPALWSSETLVVLEVLEKKALGQARSERRVSSFVAIEEDWLLEMPWFREETKEEFDVARGRAERVLRWVYGSLTLLEERSLSAGGGALLLVDEVMKKGWKSICEEGGVEQLCSRIALLRKFGARGIEPSEFPDPSNDWLRAALVEFAEGKSKLAELEGADFLSYLKYRMEPRILSALEKEAPETLTLAKGRRVRIHYQSDKAPWTASRLQDFFGMKDTPCVASGKQKLTLHLLAPNQRPVQVTSDLSGFWARGYAEVRKELFRRYPRHSWPENPDSGE